MSGPHQRFPQTLRLRKRPQFLDLAQKGHRVHTRHFILQALANQEPAASLGVTVTKRVGNAVVRNRIKRRVREAFRTTETLRACGLDLVVIAKNGSQRLTMPQVCKELLAALAKLPGPPD